MTDPNFTKNKKLCAPTSHVRVSAPYLKIRPNVLMSLCVATLTSTFLFSAPANAFPSPPAKNAPVADIDTRNPHRDALPNSKAPKANPAQLSALEDLRGQAPGLSIRWNGLTGAPSVLRNAGATLTDSSMLPPKQIAENFIKRNQALFKLTDSDLARKRYRLNAVSPNNGVTHLEIQQQVDGIDVYGAVFNVNVNKKGQIINMGGMHIPDAANKVNRTTPLVTDKAALDAAAESAGLETVTDSRSDGLVIFPVTAQDLRLAWNVVVENHRLSVSYRIVVDAENGDTLLRHMGIRESHIAVHGQVFDGDSPIPNTPIGSTDGSTVARVDRPFHGAGQVFPRDGGTPIFAHNTLPTPPDPHYDWWNGATADVSTSNNVDAYEDRDGNDMPGMRASPTGVDFTQPLDLTQDPSNYTAFSITNLFYWVNHMHDVWYKYGFTEAFRNYQSDNLGLGGSGGDPVLAETQDNRDGGSLCNANFNTNATEGNSGRMQMFQCNNSTPERDSSLNTGTVIHEFHHGLAERLRPSLHGGDCGPPGSQGSAIGEGGGDFQALLVLAEAADDPNGLYAYGQYHRNNPNGLRSAPYSIRPGVFPKTYTSINDATGGSSECHSAGEVWANTLWIARTLLVGRYGYLNGTKVMMQLQLDGYKMAAIATPDFLEMRDAILDADAANTDNGDNQCLLWSAFARMGMGYSASSTGHTDTAPIEAFDTPPTCTPVISTNPTVLDFGLVPVNPIGGESGFKSLNFNVCDVGNTDLFLTNALLQAANPAYTVFPPTKGYPLQINHICHPIEVQCNPGSAGLTTATVQLESNDPVDPLLTPIALSCTGAVPSLQVSPNPLAFGNVPIDTANGTQSDSLDMSLKVRNPGTSNLQVTGITVSGGNAAGDFALLPPVTGLPTIIAPGAEFDFKIRFNPSAVGDRNTTLQIASNAGTSDISATGTGVEPDISVTGSTDFGAMCADEQVEHEISVCNNTTPPENGRNNNLVVSSAGVDCPDFTIVSNPFPGIVEHGLCHSLTIRFTPTSAGLKSCHLTINSNDPDTPSEVLDLTGDAPLSQLQMPASQSFLPEVVQNIGACSTQKPLPVVNPGQCKTKITDVAVSGENSGDYALSGLPPLATLLEPGHQLGEGGLKAVFAPTELDRDRLATVSVTYVQDPFANTTATITHDMCGEGVNTGARVLVAQGGVPLANVAKIQLLRVTGNRNKRIVDSVDNALNLDLQTVTPASPCKAYQYHREYGTVANPIQLLPGTYGVTVTAIINGRKKSKTVAFEVGTCDFNPTVIVNF